MNTANLSPFTPDLDAGILLCWKELISKMKIWNPIKGGDLTRCDQACGGFLKHPKVRFRALLS